MGAELSCFHFKHATATSNNATDNNNTSNSNSNYSNNSNNNYTSTSMPSSQAMTFEVYTPQPPSTNVNSVTRNHSASRSDRRRPSRFSFSESHDHNEEGQSNLSVAQFTIPEETSTTDGQPPRSLFAFASSFSFKPKKHAPSLPLTHLYIDPKPLPSMLVYSETTPKGADIVQYPHFCPICYRHFADIYRTQCCGHNICYSCSQNHIESKQKLSKINGTRVKSEAHIPCPNCNTDHVKFERLRIGDKSRIYCESPTTKELMERSQQKQSPVSTSAFYCNTPSMIQQAPINAL